MFHRAVFFVGIVGMLVSGASNAMHRSLEGMEEPVVALTLFELIEPAALDQWMMPLSAGCHTCDDLCSVDEFQRHETQENPQGEWNLPSPSAQPRFHGCSGASSLGECWEQHVTGCVPTFAMRTDDTRVEMPLHEFVNVLLHQPLSVVKEIVTRNPEHVRFDLGRHALHVIGCEGSIVAHIPFAPSVTIQ